MRSAALFLCSILVLASVAVGFGTDGALADDEQRTIPVSVVENGLSTSTSEWGEACQVSLHPLRTFPAQVVIRDQADVIVAVWTIEGDAEAVSATSNRCIAFQEISVPEATFYTVYLNEERLLTIDAADMPLSAEDAIRLNFQN